MAFASLTVSVSFLSVVAFSNVLFCNGQFLSFRNYESTPAPILPFPACRIDSVDCLRTGLRTFFVLMETGHLGMKSVDPISLNSVTVALPNEQMSILMRRVNVTGAKWTKLADRKFNLPGGKHGVVFTNNLHITGEITVSMAGRIDPLNAHIIMDLHETESNITYPISVQRGIDYEDYLLIGPERIAVRNTRLPTFFMQPDSRGEARANGTANTEDSFNIQTILSAREPILDHLANEITISVMHSIVDNFRLFSYQVPVKNYYIYKKQ